jgi:hypothetical protein
MVPTKRNSSAKHKQEAVRLTKHGPASVDHLQLTVAAEGLGIGGQTGSVPSVV